MYASMRGGRLSHLSYKSAPKSHRRRGGFLFKDNFLYLQIPSAVGLPKGF
jgi:hypothetical protein